MKLFSKEKYINSDIKKDIESDIIDLLIEKNIFTWKEISKMNKLSITLRENKDAKVTYK